MSSPHSNTTPPAEFPQAQPGLLIEGLLGLVAAITTRAEALATAPAPKPALNQCEFEEEGWPCYHPATIHHLASEHDFCRVHYRKVTRA